MKQIWIAATLLGFLASSAVAGGSTDNEYECKLPEKYLCGEPDGGEDKGKARGKEKMAVCHKGRTLYLPRPAAQAHMRHGDKPGKCVNKKQR